MSDTYTVAVCCKNCGFSGEVDIPMGTWISGQPCPVCGCDALSKDFGEVCQTWREEQEG